MNPLTGSIENHIQGTKSSPLLSRFNRPARPILHARPMTCVN